MSETEKKTGDIEEESEIEVIKVPFDQLMFIREMIHQVVRRHLKKGATEKEVQKMEKDIFKQISAPPSGYKPYWEFLK